MFRWLATLFAACTLMPVCLADDGDDTLDQEFLEFLGLWESDDDEDWIELMEIMVPRDSAEQASASEVDDRG